MPFFSRFASTCQRTAAAIVLAAACGVARPAVAAESQSPAAQFHATWNAAATAALADHSLVLLIFGSERCVPCLELKKQTLASAEFKEKSGTLHIAEVDVDADVRTARAFDVSLLPTLVLLSGDGKIVLQATGFMSASELLRWLEEGRRRAGAGQWEGTAPGTKLDEFIRKAAADELTTNDIERLVALLGEPDPVDRADAAKILLAQRDRAVASLIEALKDPYLGVRIGACELLHELAPDRTQADPWQSPAELQDAVVRWKNWWTEAGSLPVAVVRTNDPALETSIETALRGLTGDDPVRRTEAMAMLVGHSTAALPRIREALQRSERTGDHRAVALLEDVRWAILISDSLERQANGARASLARGTGSERQSVATRLGRVGPAALPALTELVGDADPLVVESAVRALSEIADQNSVPAMAALLHASDGNLRMTAAQALGRAGNADAIKPLLAAFNDPNEIVACAAISAVEEILSNKKLFRGPVREEICQALTDCMSDSRWRVRAAAAEVAGKLSASELAPQVKKLLDDPDSFVVNNALTALGKLNSIPDPDALAALARRLPALRAQAIEMILDSRSSESVRLVTEMFDSGSSAEQVLILNTLARHEPSSGAVKAPDWKPLLVRGATAPDARLRRAATEVLAGSPPVLVSELIAPLLADEDRETRVTAAGALLGVLAGEPAGASQFGLDVARYLGNGESRDAKTNKYVPTPEQLAQWHSALLQRSNVPPDLRVAAAVLATGDGRSDLPMLLSALDKSDLNFKQRISHPLAIRLILAKLSWPEGKPALEKMCAYPSLFAMAAYETRGVAPAIAEFLLEPARFRSAVEPATGIELEYSMQMLIGYEFGESKGWSLLTADARSRAILDGLLSSTNAGWRSAAIYCLGIHGGESDRAVIERALGDLNSWVRVAAVQSFVRKTKDRRALEERLGPLLSDSSAQVASVAAVALLEPEIRSAASLESSLEYFEFQNVRGGTSGSFTSRDERPLTTLEGKPEFLSRARRWLTATNAGEFGGFALLLAQYGEFDGLDQAIARTTSSRADAETDLDSVVLTGIALSHEVKYVPVLRRMAEGQTEDYELRRILQALRGMTGAEARQLRLDINRQMRKNVGSSPFD